MSKQLTFSATLSVLAMAAMALLMSAGAPESGGARGATAHGSIVSVLISS